MYLKSFLYLLLSLCSLLSQSNAQDPEDLNLLASSTSPTLSNKIIDLSYPQNDSVLHWLGSIRLVGTPENTGGVVKDIIDKYLLDTPMSSHIEAPRRFNKSGWSVDKIPLDRLIDVPLSLVDLSDLVQANRTYSFTKNDFIDAKTGKSKIVPNSVVLVYTGLSKLFKQGGKKDYLGTSSNNTSDMSFPGFSIEATKYLVEQGVYGVGLDSPSVDSSQQFKPNISLEATARGILSSANIYMLEDMNDKLGELVKIDTLMRLTAAPLALTDGLGSMARIVAVPSHVCHIAPANSASSQMLQSSMQVILTAFIVILITRREL